MNRLNKSNNQRLILIMLAFISISFNSATANSDMEAMKQVQRAREMARSKADHSEHQEPVDASLQFRGFYYGYLPCKHCAGIKMTLSLKNNKNYLLVTQYAQASTKEYFDKGKYTWDAKSQRVSLISRKDSSIQKYLIKDDATLILLDSNGSRMKGDQSEYTLKRSDKRNSREVHIH